MKNYILSLLILLISTGAFAKVSENERKIFITEKLQNKPNLIAFYVPGSICGSCSIGLFIHIGKIVGIDKGKLDKGVELNVKNQVLFISSKSESPVLINQVKNAIEKAGYEPSLWYKWHENSLITNSFKNNI